MGNLVPLIFNIFKYLSFICFLILSSCNQEPIAVQTSNPKLSAGGNHTIVIKSSTAGSVWAWGANYQGMLGVGNTIDSNIPLQTCNPDTTAICSTFLSEITQVTGGYEHTAALKRDGTVWAWRGGPQILDKLLRWT